MSRRGGRSSDTAAVSVIRKPFRWLSVVRGVELQASFDRWFIVGRWRVGASDGGGAGGDDFPDGVGEGVDEAAAVGQLGAQIAATPVPGRLQVFEADAGRGQLGGHCDTENSLRWKTRISARSRGSYRTVTSSPT